MAPPSARQFASPTRSKFSRPFSPSMSVSQSSLIGMPAHATITAIAVSAKTRFMVPPPRMDRKILDRLVARDALARLAYVVAAQLAQGIRGKIVGHFLAPVEIHVGVVQGLGAIRHELGRLRDHLIGEPLAFQEVARFLDEERPRGDGAQGDACFFHYVPGELQRG